MKVVKLNTIDGHIPLRASKNPVIGVFRHHCGNIASVHQPQGRKAKLRYLICDECKTDQAAGETYQAKIRANTYDSIELLEAAEKENQASKSDSTVNLTDNKLLIEPLAKAIETNKNAVADDIEPLKKVEPELTDDLTDNESLNLTYKDKPTVIEKEKTIEKQTPTDNGKGARVAVASVVGGLFGGLLALIL